MMKYTNEMESFFIVYFILSSENNQKLKCRKPASVSIAERPSSCSPVLPSLGSLFLQLNCGSPDSVHKFELGVLGTEKRPWLPWLLELRLFNILELVNMDSPIKTFQHSRTGYHGYSDQSNSTF